MYQEIQDLGVLEVHPHNADTVQRTVQEIDCTVQETDCTVEDLTALLGVKRRAIFAYAKTICEAWHWEPETVFKPVFGRYSECMVREMKRLQEMGTAEYLKAVGIENQRPIAIKEKPGSLATTNTSHLAELDQKISNLQQETASMSGSLADRIRLKVSEINRTNQSAQQRQRALDDAEIISAENRGYEKALEIFEAEERAKEETLAQLRAMKIHAKNQ